MRAHAKRHRHVGTTATTHTLCLSAARLKKELIVTRQKNDFFFHSNSCIKKNTQEKKQTTMSSKKDLAKAAEKEKRAEKQKKQHKPAEEEEEEKKEEEEQAEMAEASASEKDEPASEEEKVAPKKAEKAAKVSTLGRGKERLLLKKKKKSKSRSSRADLLMPVSRVHRHLKDGRYAKRIGAGAPVYIAAVLEYLASEVLELAGNAARENNLKRITPRMITMALRNDEELSKLVSKVVIAQGGVLPNIHSVLVPKKAPAKSTLAQEKEANE
jgi:histone H2A